MFKTKLQTYEKKYGSLLAFLTIELLLFTSLNLANYGMLFRYLSIALALALLPITLLRYRQEDWLNISLMFILPLLAYGAFMAFSPLYYLLQSIVDNIAMIFSIIAFLLIGASVAQSENFHIERGFNAIVGGLGVLLLISLVYTIWRYTFFYVLRFQGMALYFDGEAYMISNEAKWLFGFEFNEVVIAYFARHGAVLSSLLVALFFVPFKRLSKWDYVWIGAGGIGLLSLLLLPSFNTLKYLIPALLLGASLRFIPWSDRIKNILGYALISAASIFALAALFLTLFAFEVGFAVDLVNNNALLNYLYGNSVVVGYAEVLQASIAHPFGGLHPIIVGNSFLESTRSSIFDTLYQGGIFAALGLLVFLGFGVYSMIRYYKNGTDSKHVKVAIISYSLTYVLLTMLRYDYAPFVRETQRVYKLPFFSDLTMLLIVFLVGYAYQNSKSTSKKENAVIDQTASEITEIDLV